jgi:cyclase
MNRREFLWETAMIAAAGCVLPGYAWGQKAKPTGFQLLREGVGTFTGRGGTMGWYISDEMVIVIDSQYQSSAKKFVEVLTGHTSRKIDRLINTHHHKDHTDGNGVLKEAGARTIIANENVPRLQKAHNSTGDNAETLAYADRLFKRNWRMSLHAESVSASHYGAGHTGGDAIIHFEKANVVHMGDLVFNRLYPFIDLKGEATVPGWISVLEKAAKIYPSDAIYICGHGKEGFGVTAKRDDLLMMRDYLSALWETVEADRAAGKSLDEMKERQGLDRFSDFSGGWPGAFQANIEAAFKEMEG